MAGGLDQGQRMIYNSQGPNNLDSIFKGMEVADRA